MDGQLYAILENISMTKFTLALVELCKRDNSVFKILTDVSFNLSEIQKHLYWGV